MVEPSETLTTGDHHEGDGPAHVDSTTGHDLGLRDGFGEGEAEVGGGVGPETGGAQACGR
jgi:hypothetical protein